MSTDIPEFPHGGAEGLTRAVLYNDPLIGLIDAHLLRFDMKGYYEKASALLCNMGRESAEFAPAFEVVYKLSRLLERKADFGIRLKSAYDRCDREALRALCDECDLIIEGIHALRLAHRTAWLEYCKPFGWEVHDIRYGGLVMRFETVKKRVADYLDGAIDKIDELLAERIPFIGTADCADYNWRGYPGIASVSRFD